MDSLKSLRAKVKELRSAVSKPLTKATVDDLRAEIAHHETAMKASASKAKRLEALAKAREAKAGKKVEIVKTPNKTEAVTVPRKVKVSEEVVSIPKKEFVSEHKKLVRELVEAKPVSLRKEAVKQSEELAKVMKGKGSKVSA